MSDLIFRYRGPVGSPAPYGDPVIVSEVNLPYWIKMLIQYNYAPDDTPPFVPEYEQFTLAWTDNEAHTVTAPIEQPLGVPTRKTADILAQRFAIKGIPLRILEVPWIGSGPATSTAVTRLFQFPNFATLPVKQFCEYFSGAPEGKFPHVAEKECKDLIARVWQG